MYAFDPSLHTQSQAVSQLAQSFIDGCIFLKVECFEEFTMEDQEKSNENTQPSTDPNESSSTQSSSSSTESSYHEAELETEWVYIFSMRLSV